MLIGGTMKLECECGNKHDFSYTVTKTEPCDENGNDIGGWYEEETERKYYCGKCDAVVYPTED
jgi:hypothetical protein